MTAFFFGMQRNRHRDLGQRRYPVGQFGAITYAWRTLTATLVLRRWRSSSRPHSTVLDTLKPLISP